MDKFIEYGRGKLTSTPKSDERENVPKRGRFESPVVRNDEKYSDLVPITPMPDYDTIDTPEIHRQAQKYGMKKKIGKKKLRMKLKEVYMYTHQTASPDLSRNDEDPEESLRKEQRQVNSSPAKDKIADDSDVVFLDMSDVHQLSSSFSKDQEAKSSSPVMSCDRTSQNAEVISLLDSYNETSRSEDQINMVDDKLKTSNSTGQVTHDVTMSSDFLIPYLDDDLPVLDVNKNKTLIQNFPCANISRSSLPPEKGNTLSRLRKKSNMSSEVISLLDESEIQEEGKKGKGTIKEKDLSFEPAEVQIVQSPPDKKEKILNTLSLPRSENIKSSGGDDDSSTNKDDMSCQDMFEDFYDENNDSFDEDGSDHEELHRSLFVSIHENEKESQSDSSSEEDSECISLMQRILQKKKLNSGSTDEISGNSEDKQTVDGIIPSATNLPSVLKDVKSIMEKEMNSPARNVTEKCEKQLQSQNKVDYFNKQSMVKAIPGDIDMKTKKLKKKKVKLDENELNLAIFNAICSNDKISDSVLQYKPIYLSQFRKLMDDSGIKVSANNLLDFLDSQGITFSTADENKGKTRLKKKK